MYDYLIATDEGLAQSISQNGEKEEASEANGINGTNAKEDAELLGDSEKETIDSENEAIDSENEAIDSEKETIDSENEDDNEDFALEDSSQSEKEDEETQTDDYNVSRGIDFEGISFFSLSSFYRRGCSHKLLNACLCFALRSSHWPNRSSWKLG